MGLPAACPHKGCRGGRTCCGPRGATAAYPGAVLPACLAEAFEALYAPVLRWRALTDAMDSAVARLDEMEAKAASAGQVRR
jgi:hypothetical protein